MERLLCDDVLRLVLAHVACRDRLRVGGVCLRFRRLSMQAPVRIRAPCTRTAAVPRATRRRWPHMRWDVHFYAPPRKFSKHAFLRTAAKAI